MTQAAASHPEDFSFHVLQINGESQNQQMQHEIHVDTIRRGGFRFTSELTMDIEDKVEVLLAFPDQRAQHVLGRISMRNDIDADFKEYCFSVLDGFYRL